MNSEKIIIKIHYHNLVNKQVSDEVLLQILNPISNLNFYYNSNLESKYTLFSKLINKNAKLLFEKDYGWDTEVSLNNRRRFDFSKNIDGIQYNVELELRNTDSIIIDFYKFNYAYEINKSVVGILLVPDEELSKKIRKRAASFEKAIEYINDPFWKNTIAPIIIIGISKDLYDSNDIYNNDMRFLTRPNANFEKNITPIRFNKNKSIDKFSILYY